MQGVFKYFWNFDAESLICIDKIVKNVIIMLTKMGSVLLYIIPIKGASIWSKSKKLY